MFRFRSPSPASIRAFLESQAALSFTYSDVGSTATNAPACYIVDRTRVQLGRGEVVFQRARAALKRWKQFDLEWLRIEPADTPVTNGTDVAVVARALGVWSVHAARVVYVVDEPRKFGYAYGTLPGHAESGEERFLVEHADDESVWYDILAFSQPRHVLARLGYPFVRRLQKRFGRESAAAMVRAVGGESSRQT